MKKITFKTFGLSLAFLIMSVTVSAQVLWDNGPFITHLGIGSNGSDYSMLQMNNEVNLGLLGAGCHPSVLSLVDDFVVNGTWTASTMTFYAYQFEVPLPSILDDVRVRIWDGSPLDGGTVIWGNLNDNLFQSTVWTNSYRVLELAPNEERAINEIVADVSGLVLAPGTYWVEYQIAGGPNVFPSTPPISILGEKETGNALQGDVGTGVYEEILDGVVGDFNGQGVPFVVEGTVTGLLTNDLSITEIVDPSTAMFLGDEEVAIKIYNVGSNSQSGFDVSYSIDGGTPVVETISATVNSLEFYSYTFSTLANLSVLGTHNIEACVLLTADENAANDCLTKEVIHIDPDYCGATTANNTEWISNIQFGAIDNSSAWQGGISDYTNISTSIPAGDSEGIIVTNGSPFSPYHATVWVDWNSNYQFEQGGEEEFVLVDPTVDPILNPLGDGETFIGDIVVPANVEPGDYRMRVRLHFSNPELPCGESNYGEVEDYTITTTSLSIEDNLFNTISVVPNPATDFVKIDSRDLVKTVTVYNLLGQVIHAKDVSNTADIVNTSNFKSGIYIFQIDTELGAISKRVIIE